MALCLEGENGWVYFFSFYLVNLLGWFLFLSGSITNMVITDLIYRSCNGIKSGVFQNRAVQNWLNFDLTQNICKPYALHISKGRLSF